MLTGEMFESGPAVGQMTISVEPMLRGVPRDVLAYVYEGEHGMFAAWKERGFIYLAVPDDGFWIEIGTYDARCIRGIRMVLDFAVRSVKPNPEGKE